MTVISVIIIAIKNIVMIPYADKKIVRVNAGHDSNIMRKLVLDSTAQCEHRFYNSPIRFSRSCGVYC